MIDLDLNDKHLSENIKAIQYLRELGVYSDEELQRLYNEQVQKDKGEEE